MISYASPLLWTMAAVVSLVSLIVYRWVHRRWDRFRRVSRAQQAIRGEINAEKCLRKRGFTVVDRGSVAPWRVDWGSNSSVLQLKADLIVRRGREHFVAEVKTGRHVTDIRHGATRRQLLEYLLAFDVDGVLLVDGTSQHIDEVRFPQVVLRKDTWHGWSKWLVYFGLIVALSVALWLEIHR